MTKPGYKQLPCSACNGTGYVEINGLAHLRSEAGLSQEEVAEQLGLTRTSLSNIERGVQAVSLDKVKILADLYGVDEYTVYDIAKTFKVRRNG